MQYIYFTGSVPHRSQYPLSVYVQPQRGHTGWQPSGWQPSADKCSNLQVGHCHRLSYTLQTIIHRPSHSQHICFHILSTNLSIFGTVPLHQTKMTSSTVNINTASLEELMKLDQIADKRAEVILNWRKEKRPLTEDTLKLIPDIPHSVWENLLQEGKLVFGYEYKNRCG